MGHVTSEPHIPITIDDDHVSRSKSLGVSRCCIPPALAALESNTEGIVADVSNRISAKITRQDKATIDLKVMAWGECFALALPGVLILSSHEGTT